ncbi:MAG TPA: arginine--tRNA ligase [Microthrixaceae bacterium]|nr:arginine--tRNA ligase [Microthrixaceae bacterium]
MIRDTLTDAIRSKLASLGVDAPAVIGLEQPARSEHGDWSSNVALATAKAAGRNPRELAQELADRLNADLPAHTEKVEIAGPGFVNFHLRPTWLHDVIGDVLAAGDAAYGRSDDGAGDKVLVEFVSANPTGPLHAGHARGAVFGDTLARILEWSGHEVGREFYINDRGLQMENFGASIAARARGEQPPEDGYQGEYVTEWAADLGPDADPLEHGYSRALADQREVLDRLGVVFDSWFSERTMIGSGAIDQTLADLRERGVVYDDDGAVWLRSTDYGDDKDRVLVRSNGEVTYLLPDIAYHRDKFARGYDHLINVWGADHHGYVSRMRAAIATLGHDAESFEPVITQLVRLTRDGNEVRLSKRSGDMIELRDLLDEVGVDAVRLTYLLQSVDSPQSVDLDVIISESMENPVFYVQMAHARLCSIDKVATERGFTRRPLADVDLSPLVHERELAVLRDLHALPTVVALAARERAPHKVTTWARDLASDVHGFYHDCPILRDDVDDATRQARWWLCAAAAVGLRVGLGLLGVSAPESMQ